MGRKEDALGLLEKAQNSVVACKAREWNRIVRDVDREEE